MQFMKTPIIFLLTMFSLPILIATPVRSETIRVASSGNGDLYYIDTDSIYLDRSFVKAFVNIKYKKLSSRGVASAAIEWRSQCSYKNYTINEYNFYGLSGKLLWSDRKPSSKWKAIKPNSVDEDIYNFMCNFKR